MLTGWEPLGSPFKKRNTPIAKIVVVLNIVTFLTSRQRAVIDQATMNFSQVWNNTFGNVILVKVCC